MLQTAAKTLLSPALVGLGVLLATQAAADGRQASGDPADIAPPHGAHAGQCFAKVREPDAVERFTERVLVHPAGSSQRVIPAVTRTVDKEVTVSPARTETTVHPAVFRTEWKTTTEPGRSTRIDTPARYEMVTRQVMVEPAHEVWKRGAGRPVNGQSYPGAVTYEATGEVLCRVLIPARYAETTQRVLVSPAVHRTVQAPPVVRRTAERVQVSPEHSEQVQHPAVVKTVHETVVVTPARTETMATPAEYRTVERSRSVVRYGWQPVVCDTPAPAPQPLPLPPPMRAPCCVAPPPPCCAAPSAPRYSPQPYPPQPYAPQVYRAPAYGQPYGERG